MSASQLTATTESDQFSFHFRQFAESVFFFENAKFVLLHFLKQAAINRPHDLGGDHRSSIFMWKHSRCTREKLTRTRCFKLHQSDEALIVLSILQFGFGVPETRQIFLRQIDAAVA